MTSVSSLAASAQSGTDIRLWQRVAFDGMRVLGIAADPLNPGRVYALAALPGSRFSPSNSADFYRSDNGGETWRQVSTVGSYSVVGIGISATGRIWIPEIRGPGYVSDDEGETWMRGSQPIQVSAFAIAPSNPSRMYVTGSLGLVDRSDDGGLTWTEETLGTRGCTQGSIAVDPVDADIVYVGGGCGLHKSQDGGATWVQLLDLYAVMVLVNPTNPGIVYGGNASLRITGRIDERRGLWRSGDAGITWTNQSEQPGSISLLIFDRRDATFSTLVARGSYELFWSPDAGSSWTPLGMPTDTTLLPFPWAASNTVAVGDRLLVGYGNGMWATMLPPERPQPSGSTPSRQGLERTTQAVLPDGTCDAPHDLVVVACAAAWFRTRHAPVLMRNDDKLPANEFELGPLA